MLARLGIKGKRQRDAVDELWLGVKGRSEAFRVFAVFHAVQFYQIEKGVQHKDTQRAEMAQRQQAPAKKHNASLSLRKLCGLCVSVVRAHFQAGQNHTFTKADPSEWLSALCLLPFAICLLPFAFATFLLMHNSSSQAAGEKFQELVELIARLRAPGGCPWDREQTHESLKPMLIEEAYEVLEAIDERDDEELAGELGDLLLQVIFHSQISFEENRFNAADVIERVSSKMIHRHPHVFGDDKSATSGEVLRNWEAIKEAELVAKGKKPDQEGSMLDSVSKSLPAMMEAFQMTTKVSRVDFDWPNVGEVLNKLDEEVNELKHEIATDASNHQRISDEIGDLLFVAVNVARLSGVDPESALKSSNRKFRRRFRYIEDRLRQQGRKPADSDHIEMNEYWDEAKQQEKLAKAED
jgi:MazG family protein